MYATVEEANAYIASYYSSKDNLRLAWEELSDEDKQVMINRSERSINQLPFTGSPVDKNTMFPRNPNPDNSLEQVKIATIELSIHSLDETYKTRYDLQQQGVKSYEIGDLKETFGLSQGSTSYSGIDSYTYAIVFPYLKDYLGGGYSICPTRMPMFNGKDTID